MRRGSLQQYKLVLRGKAQRLTQSNKTQVAAPNQAPKIPSLSLQLPHFRFSTQEYIHICCQQCLSSQVKGPALHSWGPGGPAEQLSRTASPVEERVHVQGKGSTESLTPAGAGVLSVFSEHILLTLIPDSVGVLKTALLKLPVKEATPES